MCEDELSAARDGGAGMGVARLARQGATARALLKHSDSLEVG